MAMLPVILGIGQKCPHCGQRSSPKMNQGNWEVMGLWGGSINRCTKCESLIRVGFLSDEPLSKEESEKFLAARNESFYKNIRCSKEETLESKLREFDELASSLLVYPDNENIRKHAVMSIGSGYKVYEAITHSMVFDTALRVSEADNDIAQIIVIAGDAKATIKLFADFKNDNLASSENISNDAQALLRVVTIDKDHKKWLNAVLDDLNSVNDK